MEISRRNLSVFFFILYSILYSVIKYSFAFERNSFKLLIQTYVVITWSSKDPLVDGSIN